MMDRTHTANAPADLALDIIRTGFEDFSAAFATITQRASRRFESRDWRGMRRDTVERLDLYPEIVDDTTNLLLRSLGPKARQPALWADIKKQYSLNNQNRCDFDIACTFYNSIHRKLFTQTHIDPDLTFATPPPEAPQIQPELFFDFAVEHLTPSIIAAILSQFRFRTTFSDLAEDARQCTFRIGELMDRLGGSPDGLRIQMLNTPFFRGMSAYLV
jgi:isocitrate dehydrogenase kinase/phosphatase